VRFSCAASPTAASSSYAYAKEWGTRLENRKRWPQTIINQEVE
jgi:hypothetical protein